MPDDLRSLATAHRALAGVSLLAVLLVVLGSVASLVEIINAPPGALRWAAAAILVLVGLCWLVTVLRSRPPEPTTVLGYLSAAMLIAGAALAGWNTAAAPAARSDRAAGQRHRPPRPGGSWVRQLNAYPRAALRPAAAASNRAALDTEIMAR